MAKAQTSGDTALTGSSIRPADAWLGRIVYRIGLAGRAYCPETLPLTGLLFHHLAEYRSQDRSGIIAIHALDRGPGILAVLPDSPAAGAGLLAGDVLLRANGQPFASPLLAAAEREPSRRRALLNAAEIQLEEQLRAGPVELDILRSGRRLGLTLGSRPGCPARSRLARSHQLNAFADGRYAIMTTGFLSFFRSDEELAVAMAHELAHNILRHPARLEAEGVPHGLGRSSGRNARLVRATEQEADRLAVKLLWSAGYDVGAIMPFWRRLHERFGDASTHPDLEQRSRIVEEAIAEIRGASVAD